MKTSFGLTLFLKNAGLCIVIVLLVTIGIFAVPPSEADKDVYEFQLIANLVFNTVGSIILSVVHTYLISKLSNRSRAIIIRKSILYSLLLGVLLTVLVYLLTVGLLIYMVPGALVYGWVVGRIMAKYAMESPIEDNR